MNWPVTDSSLHAFSQLVLAWVIACYYIGRTESVWGRVHLTPTKSWWTPALPRVVLVFVAPFIALYGQVARGVVVAVVGVVLALALTYAREKGSDKWRDRGAEIELGVTGVYALVSALLVGNSVIAPFLGFLLVPSNERRTAALYLAAAILLFLVRGGTQLVRAILNKAGSLPTVQTDVDEVEYNRGRLIGSIERLLLAGVVAAGSYAALGFLVAAKGLIRSKDLERRDFAEYFLVGTLASTALALVAGGLLRLVFISLW